MPAPRKQRSGVSFQGRPHKPTKDELEEMSAVDRLRRVEPFWKQLSHQERLELMTFSIKEVKAQAVVVTRKLERDAEEMLEEQQKIMRAESRLGCGPGCCGKDCGWVVEKHKLSKCPDERLAEGLKRLAANNTWNQWQWDPKSPAFHSVHSFWEHVKDKHIPAALRSGLPKAKGTLQEQAALKRLTERMAALSKQLTCAVRDLADDSASLEAERRARSYYLAPSQQEEQESMRIKQAYLGLIKELLETLSEEDIFLYDSIVQPAAQYVCKMLEGGLCPGSTDTDLCFADLSKLPEEEIAKLCAWMTDKVEAIASGHAQVLMQIDTQLKAHHTSDDDDIGDVDIFVLTKDGMKLTVNRLWLAHLQTRIMFACGHVHRTQRGQDPYSIGAVLEWVFGMYVSKYEYGRNIAKTPLDHRASTKEASELLVKALHERQVMDEELKKSQQILEGQRQDRKLYADLVRKYDLRLAESKRAEPTALRITVGPVSDDYSLPARATTYATPEAQGLSFFRAPEITSTDPSLNPRSSTAQAGSSPSRSMGGAGRLDSGEARGPASTKPQGNPQGRGQASANSPQSGGQASANSQNSNTEGRQQMLPDHVVMLLLRREMRLAYACNHAWTLNDMQEDKKLFGLRRLLEQCQPQFAQLVAAMQQLDKRFLREKQKVDHLGRDCCVIPMLRALFPKLSVRGIQERCGMIDKYRAYEREMQHYQKQIDTLEYEEGHRRHGLEYIGILGAHMVETLHAYERFTQADNSQGTAEAGSRLSKIKPSPQASASSQQPYSGSVDSCNTQPPVSGGAPQPPPQTDTPEASVGNTVPGDSMQHEDTSADSSEASMAHTVPGDGMQHEDTSAAEEPLVELADADSIRQYFHQHIWPGLRTVEYELSIMKFLHQHVKEGESFQAANRAALIHLEAQVINVACDDPGRAVGATVLLPILRERIESQAYAHYNKDVLLAEQKKAAKAKKALEELIAEEEQEKTPAAASKARQQQIKAKQQQSKQLQGTQQQPTQAADSADKSSSDSRQAAKQHAQHGQAASAAAADQAKAEASAEAKAEAKRAKKQRRKAKKQSGLQQAAPEQAATQLAAQPQCFAELLETSQRSFADLLEAGQRSFAELEEPSQQSFAELEETGQRSFAELMETGQQPPAQLNAADGISTLERPHVPQGRGTSNKGSASLLQSKLTGARLPSKKLPDASTASGMANVASEGQSLASTAPGPAQRDVGGSTHTQHAVTFPQGSTGDGLPTGSKGSTSDGLQTGPQLQQATAAGPVLQPQALPSSSDSTDVQSMLRSQAAQQLQQQQPQQRSQTLAVFANSLPEELYQFEHSEEEQHVASGEAGAIAGSSTKHDALPGDHGEESQAVQLQAAASVVGIDTHGAVSGGDMSEAQQAGRPWEAVLTPYKVPEEHVEALFQCPLTKALLIDPVVAADGHTYERQALQAWLQHHSISPITGEHLTHRHLVDNAVIRSLLQQQMLQGR